MIEKNKSYKRTYLTMYSIKQARKQGGSVLLTLPPGITPGYYYVSIEHQEQEPRNYLLVWEVPVGERPEKIHIVEQPAPAPQRDQGTGKRPEIVVEDGSTERST
jgi:hypothetical protein